jgi:hypothetical protein
MKMKDLSDYVVFQDEKYWIDTDCEPECDEDEDQWPTPFEVGVPFEFTIDGVTRVGVVECDDGVDEFGMIPFNIA